MHPFAVGQMIVAVLVGAVAGSVVSAPAALAGAAIAAAGVLVSCLICWAWPGLEARARLLWPIALLANPVMPLALAMIATEWPCITGENVGWGCMAVAVAVVVAGLCLLPPSGGLLWRRWKRQGLL